MKISHDSYLSSSQVRGKVLSAFSKMYIDSDWSWANGYDSKLASISRLLSGIKR